MAALSLTGLRDGVAAGRVARGAPVVRGELADSAVELDRPAERVQVVREPGGAGLLDRPPLALGGDRGRGLALLSDLQAAAGQRVQQRRLAVPAGVLAQAGGVAGDQAVAVELDQAVVDGARCAAGSAARPIRLAGTSPTRSSSARIA